MNATLSFMRSSSVNVEKYRVKYGNQEDALTEVKEFPVADLGTVNPVSVVIPDLDPMVPWYFQVFAVNPFDVESDGSNITNTATKPNAPSLLSVKSLV